MSERTASTGKPSRAESKPSLTERVQHTMSSAAREHRDNARPKASAQTSVTKNRQGGPKSRRARLRLTRIEPWSVAKTSFLLSVAFGVATFVAIFMVWSVLGAAGVWESINTAVSSIVDSEGDDGAFDVTDYVGMSRVLGFTLVVSVLNVVLLTAVATLTAFLYNLAAALLGGIDVTLAEDPH